MTSRRKPAAPEFPKDVCVACALCHGCLKEGFFCYALPSQAVVVNDTVGWAGRGAPVEPDDPKCTYFQPRQHA